MKFLIFFMRHYKFVNYVKRAKRKNLNNTKNDEFSFYKLQMKFYF